MKTSKTTGGFDRPMRLALIVGLAAAAAGVVGLFVSGADAFFQAYLFAFVFWLGISLGLMAILLLHFLMDSHWGLTVRRIAEAGTASVWVMAVLFVPILFGMTSLFPWARPEVVQESAVMQAKAFYLNTPFFIARAAVYFAVWIGLGTLVNRLAARLGSAEDAAVRARLRGWGAGGMILYILTMSFAAMDWLMSLQPLWNSSIFGLIIIIGQVLTALAFAVVTLNLLPDLSLGRRWTYETTPVPYSDLGALLFTFIFGWTYLAYFQLLIIWAGNLPRETVWYIARIEGGWNVLAIIVAVFQFAVPFLILLSVRARHNLRVLAALGAMLLGAYLVNMFWHVKPAFSPGQFAISWLDLVLPVALGGIWLAAFLRALARRPALSEAEAVTLKLKGEQRQHSRLTP